MEAAGQAFKAFSMAEGIRLPSLPTVLLTSKPALTLTLTLLPSISFPRPRLSSSRSPPLLPHKKMPSLVPLVARTSEWARQDEEEQVQAEHELLEGEDLGDWQSEDDDGGEAAGQGAKAGLSEWAGQDGDVDGEVSSEGEGGFVEGEDETYAEPPEEAKIFVGNLPYDMDSENLAQLFEKAGIVEVAEVIYNRETDQSRGFGFVTMSTVEEAEKAIDMLNRYDVNGRLLTVNKAAPRGARVERTPRDFEPSFRIYAGNLPWQVDDARVEQVFSEHGTVVDARVVYDRETGRSRGFGFVRMASQTEMDDAIAALDGQNLDGRALRVNAAERPRRASF